MLQRGTKDAALTCSASLAHSLPNSILLSNTDGYSFSREQEDLEKVHWPKDSAVGWDNKGTLGDRIPMSAKGDCTLSPFGLMKTSEGYQQDIHT